MSETVERVAKAIWENQRAKINDPNGLNASLEWRDKPSLSAFWDSYVDDARVAIDEARK